MSVEYGLVTDDYTVGDDYRREAAYPARPGAPGGGGEGAPLLAPGQGYNTTFTQIEHVSIQTPATAQPSLIHIDGKPVYVPDFPLYPPTFPTRLVVPSLFRADHISLAVACVLHAAIVCFCGPASTRQLLVCCTRA
jgi:hypothetical protein